MDFVQGTTPLVPSPMLERVRFHHEKTTGESGGDRVFIHETPHRGTIAVGGGDTSDAAALLKFGCLPPTVPKEMLSSMRRVMLPVRKLAQELVGTGEHFLIISATWQHAGLIYAAGAAQWRFLFPHALCSCR